MVEQFSSALSQAAWWRCCQVPGHAEAMEWMLIATKLDGVMFCGVWGFFLLLFFAMASVVVVYLKSLSYILVRL